MWALVIFSVVFTIVSKSSVFEDYYPETFLPKHSSVQMIEGDVYGICAPIESLRDLNVKLAPLLSQLTSTPFFRSYKVNLERECPFWAQQRLCNNNKCAICECEDKDIPAFWKDQQESSQPEQFHHQI